MDSLFSSSTIEYSQINDADYHQICETLSSYDLYQLNIYHRSVIVNYASGETSIYPYSNSISIGILTSINRDFNTNVILNESALNLIARNTCIAIQEQVENVLGPQVDIAMVLYDPFAGTTINYNTHNFSGNCAQFEAGSIAFGSYADPDQLTEFICK